MDNKEIVELLGELYEAVEFDPKGDLERQVKQAIHSLQSQEAAIAEVRHTMPDDTGSVDGYCVAIGDFDFANIPDCTKLYMRPVQSQEAEPVGYTGHGNLDLLSKGCATNIFPECDKDKLVHAVPVYTQPPKAQEASEMPAWYGMDQAWPLHTVLTELAEAASILLDQKNYDGHGHEGIRIAYDRACEIVSQLGLIDHPPQPPKAQTDDERTILEGLLTDLRWYKDAMEYTDIVSAEMLLERIEWKIESAPAAPAKAQMPAGYKLVPVEPTQNMRAAASQLFASTPKARPVDYYKAMIAAAPKKDLQS